MPKGKKTIKKEAENKKKIVIDEKKLTALFDKLSKDEIDENGDEKSNLEDDTELNLDNFEFQNFMRSSAGFSSPVLEKIVGGQPRPIFVGTVSQSSNETGGKTQESDSFKYVPGNNADEPKYIDSDSHITASAERIDFSRNRGQDFRPREATFTQSAEARAESSSPEKMWNAGRVDFEKERRKDHREREETNYDKYKPDLPKSR